MLKITKCCKARDHCYYTVEYWGAANGTCNLKYSVHKEIPTVFYNGSNYVYHFIIKVLAGEFEKQFAFLGENTEKCITFSVPVQKEVRRIDKNGKEVTKATSCRLQFTDSTKFMTSSLSHPVNNVAERFF